MLFFRSPLYFVSLASNISMPELNSCTSISPLPNLSLFHLLTMEVVTHVHYVLTLHYLSESDRSQLPPSTQTPALSTVSQTPCQHLGLVTRQKAVERVFSSSYDRYKRHQQTPKAVQKRSHTPSSGHMIQDFPKRADCLLRNTFDSSTHASTTPGSARSCLAITTELSLNVWIWRRQIRPLFPKQ